MTVPSEPTSNLSRDTGDCEEVHFGLSNASQATQVTYGLVVHLDGGGARLDHALRAGLVVLGHLSEDTALKGHLLRKKLG